jgi:uncharacterized protein YgbK (DUF1537 family)
MDDPPVNRDELLRSLPPPRKDDLSGAVRSLIQRVNRKVIVLDDDPTGTQTVHDVPVITRWSVEHLARELRDPSPASYVLTNSRSMHTTDAVALNRQLAENLREASARTGRDFVVISRSDSTLRGHFPDELEAIVSGLGRSFDAWVVCPFFEEGGRLTIHDVHYVAEDDQLVPAAKTPFAADAAFGYRHSNLRRWVVEKSGGRVPLDRIESLTIAELRRGDEQVLRRKLAALKTGSVCIVNAVSRQDLQAAVHALLQSEADGKRFLYRTAASFVAARSGIEPRPLLEPAELACPHGRGVLLVVGSYVPKTTLQLEHLLKHHNCSALELDVRRVLDDSTRDGTVAEIAGTAAKRLAADAPVVLYTSREVVRGDGPESLAIGRRISHALVEVVRAISVRPRVLVAKGGITSSDLASEACGVDRATVIGQILPGVPVWRCGPESRFPDMPLVVFPGNVGDCDALTALFEQLQ